MLVSVADSVCAAECVMAIAQLGIAQLGKKRISSICTFNINIIDPFTIHEPFYIFPFHGPPSDFPAQHDVFCFARDFFSNLQPCLFSFEEIDKSS